MVAQELDGEVAFHFSKLEELTLVEDGLEFCVVFFFDISLFLLHFEQDAGGVFVFEISDCAFGGFVDFCFYGTCFVVKSSNGIVHLVVDVEERVGLLAGEVEFLAEVVVLVFAYVVAKLLAFAVLGESGASATQGEGD